MWIHRLADVFDDGLTALFIELTSEAIAEIESATCAFSRLSRRRGFPFKDTHENCLLYFELQMGVVIPGLYVGSFAQDLGGEPKAHASLRQFVVLFSIVLKVCEPV